MLIRFGKRKGEKRLLPRILLCTVLLGFSATTAFAAQSFIETNVICGGETYKVSSISADPESIISLADITVDEDDKVILKDFVAGKNGSVIEVVKNYNVTVEDKKKKKSVLVGGKVSDALKKAKIKLSEYASTYPKKTPSPNGSSLESRTWKPHKHLHPKASLPVAKYTVRAKPLTAHRQRGPEQKSSPHAYAYCKKPEQSPYDGSPIHKHPEHPQSKFLQERSF